MQVIVEEAPGIKRDFTCATELLSATLLCTHLKLKPLATESTYTVPGLALTGHVMHASVQDLQSAIEHRRVLSFGWKQVRCMRGAMLLVAPARLHVCELMRVRVMSLKPAIAL